jgi:Mg2+-importing ATPase
LPGFWQERGAADAIQKLLAIVQTKADALRDCIPKEIPAEEIVPGDIILLKAGDVIPAEKLTEALPPETSSITSACCRPAK